MIINKISTWHKITAEKDGARYIMLDCVKSVFGGTWQKKELARGLSLAQVREIKNMYK